MGKVIVGGFVSYVAAALFVGLMRLSGGPKPGGRFLLLAFLLIAGLLVAASLNGLYSLERLLKQFPGHHPQQHRADARNEKPCNTQQGPAFSTQTAGVFGLDLAIKQGHGRGDDLDRDRQ